MTRDWYSTEDFDRFIHVLIGRWEDAIAWQAEWGSLDDEQRAVLSEDWPVNNAILMDLEDYVRRHELTDDQQAQWARLRDITARHTKTLKDMGYRVLPLRGKGRAVA